MPKLNLDPLARPPWRGRTNVDQITAAAVEYAETLRRKPGTQFVCTQGSYQGGSGDPLSAGTHDLGGVVDLRWTGDNHDIWALRAAGFAAWHRTPTQGPWPDHIHAVLIGHPKLAASAARQVASYKAGRNGLANNARDDGPRPDPIPVFEWPVKPEKPKPNPRPLRVVVCNGMSGSNVPEARSLAILNAAAEHADLLLGCEFGNVTDDQPLDPKVWDVVHDPSSPDRAGTLLAVRKTRGKVRHAWYRIGAPKGLGIRTRWLIVARLVIDPGTPHEWTPKVVAGHAPPKRAWAHWPAFMASVAARNADIAGADWNKLARAVAPALGRKVRARRILGIALRKNIPATYAREFDVGSDHPAVSVRLYPNPKESR